MQYYIQTSIEADLHEDFRSAGVAAMADVHEHEGRLCLRVSGRAFERFVQFLQTESVPHVVDKLVPLLLAKADGSYKETTGDDQQREMIAVLRPPKDG